MKDDIAASYDPAYLREIPYIPFNQLNLRSYCRQVLLSAGTEIVEYSYFAFLFYKSFY
jgi:hypothetical protein